MLEKLIFGPPGCGKTFTLINVVRDALKKGTPPDKIGFVSFSRKSVEEARARVAAELNLTEEDTPWFRTLHSTGFQWLGFNKDQVMSKYDFNNIGNEVVVFHLLVFNRNAIGIVCFAKYHVHVF